MATIKKKKSSTVSSLPVVEAFKALEPTWSEPSSKDLNPVDNEPKVSFTLEFYPTDGQESAFIGRLKKIGSEEQATLINDLNSQSILDFILKNLPKTWQKLALAPPASVEEKPALNLALSTLGEQNSVNNIATSLPLKDTQDTQRLKLEVRQDGKKSNVVNSTKVISLHFDASPFQQWTQFDASFKSLEAGVSNHNMRWVQLKNISLEIPPAQQHLKPGLYNLTCTAMAKDGAQQKTLVFTANQLLQVI